ncbi:MFS general substrate transporter [Apiospora rasikravindrae]|uniref:MFS general substrate transporter n=1 Tax=Apiospora rasikravindrae TaxID=990691 RepID=A0ABR1TYH2_9PEZI
MSSAVWDAMPRPGSTEQEHQMNGDRETTIMAGPEVEFKPTWRILGVFVVLVLLSFMSALDSSVISTSLPTITREIGGSNKYVWIANAYLFASTVTQPFYAQISNIFGRRNPFYVSVALFFLGSGLGGGAQSADALIAARVVQGLGTGGLYVLPEIIMCDFVPARYRGPYLGALLSAAAIGATIGPIIGGAIAEAHWRWIFWIKLPVVAVAMILMVMLLRLKHLRIESWRAALTRVDFLGNLIFIPSMFSIFIGLIMGGNGAAGFDWSSWRVILPLVLGGLGWIGFHIHQASPICLEPSMPSRLFKNRTSVIGFLMIFLASTFHHAVSFFVPIYFQAVKGASPLTSGVYYLPFSIAIIFLSGLAAAFLSKTGRYRPVHWAGWTLASIGAGLFSLLDSDSSPGAWIGFQIFSAGGVGFIFTVTLPSTLAALAESDVAVATGTYAFMRTLGFVWGVTISSVTFNGSINANLDIITDASVRRLLANGAAYAYAAGIGDGSGEGAILSDPSRSQVIEVYVKSLRIVWLVFVGISCLGWSLTFGEKHIDLRQEHETQFGFAQNNSTAHGDSEKQ